MSARIVAWVREGTWAATVDATAGLAAPEAEVVLLHVVDATVSEAVHGAYGGLLGRGTRTRNPAHTVEEQAGAASTELLDAAERRLGRPVSRLVRNGRIEREVVAAAEGATVLVCARDGDRSRLGPRSLGRHTRFVVDHAPCAVLLIWPDEAPAVSSIPPPPEHPPGRRPDEHPHRPTNFWTGSPFPRPRAGGGTV
jgi:nucleotide-binding universal stress UspA family protein